MKPFTRFYRYCTMIFSRRSRVFNARLGCFIVCVSCLFFSIESFAQNELASPSPPTQNQIIKAGSLIIPMDTIFQRIPGYFNLKAYGLANVLLQNEIPVMWAIKATKGRTWATSVDFLANVNRIFPDTVSAATDTFRCGPFIIDSSWASRALPIITSFANNVVVFKLNVNTTIDIRYTLTFKPHLILLNGSGYDTITVHQLTEAGFTSGSYYLQPVGTKLIPSTGYSLASDQHYTGGDTAHVNPVLRFVNQFGGNLITNCAAIGTYEKFGLMMTTGGIDSSTTGASTIYSNHNLPIAQFLGPLTPSYGEYRYWKLSSGSSFKANVYDIIKGGSVYNISGTKLRSNAEKGSNVFVLPCHDYFGYSTNTGYLNYRINGRRVFLNSVFIPPNDSTHLDFTTDIKLSMVAQPGLAVKNETFNICLILTNIGHWRAKNINVQALLPAGLTFQSYTSSKGTYNSGTGIWALDSLIIGRSDTLFLKVIINQLGNIVYNTSAINGSYEIVLPNNSASLTLFGVSRPDANKDTMIFFSPVYQDADTRGNDTDEDGGPFGNTQIVAGPYHGTAQVMSGDTIRYTLGAGYSGLDSLLYVTCDDYPLCDSAWLLINIQFPLPITLLRFDGKRANGKVELNWVTLSEKNNDYFSVERCTGNTSFEKRGSIKGAGNSNSIREYNFSDADNNDPVYYYRLRQFDFNGQFHLSPVIALSRTHGNESFKLVPNPVAKDQQLLAVMEGLQAGTSSITIADMTGREISKRTIVISENNQIEFIDFATSIERGCYMVTLSTPFETLSARLIVQ